MLALDVQLQRGSFDLEANFDLKQPVTGLFGTSGSGKSTLLNIIAGLISPQQGWLKLDNKPLFDSKNHLNVAPEKRQIGVVFQDSQLFPHLSVSRNLRYGYKRTHHQQRRFKVDDIVDLLEIGHLLNKRPGQLSTGEKQRTGLGRALLASPRMLLLDEPLAALDQGLKEQILPFLKRVKDELGLPMLYISHCLEEILYLTDQLVVINKGRILGSGHICDVINDKKIRGVVSSLGLENILAVKINRHDVESGYSLADYNKQHFLLPLAPEITSGECCYISVRSNEVAISRQRISGISIQNQIKGRILYHTQNVSWVMLYVDIGMPLAVEITLKAFAELHLQQGDEVYCLIKAHSITLLGKTIHRY
jgi:molybdate transport system ATP-binding protein